MPEKRFVAHVVSHTHWDREWYRTFEVFRLRLVDLIDDLLDLLDRDPRYGPFYLDGQMCPVEDYLEVRPEQAERLREAFRSGRVYSGPWYVQPDEFLVSGEALIRNLLIGRRLSTQWDTAAAVGYAPDAFGHPSQMPQIYRGFGIDNAVLFRGITADQVPSEFLWQSPDGSRVLCIKMPDENAYSNWFYRLRETLADTDRCAPLEPERALREVSALLEDSIAERPMTRYLLWMDGVDHIFPQPRTPDLIELVNRHLGDRVEVRAATLRQHIEAVMSEAKDLPVVAGELRVANRKWKLQALLAHVASSRIHLKQRNHACEMLLEKWAEPFSAFVWLLARKFGPPHQPGRLPSHTSAAPAAFLRHAWKTLLRNQPHDSICGCSVDQVHRDMLPRYDAVEQIGEALTNRALGSLAAWTDTRLTVPEGLDADHVPEPLAALVVYNPLGWSRSSEPIEHVVNLPADVQVPTLRVWDGHEDIPSVVEELPAAHTLEQAPHDIPVGIAIRRYRVRFLAEAPAFGYRTYHVAAKVPALPVPGRHAVEVGPDYVDNGIVRIAVASNGTMTLTDLRTGHKYEGLGTFEDGGDFGDGYNYVPPPQDRVLLSSAPIPEGSSTVFETEASPLGGCLRLHHSWYVPAGRDGQERDATAQAPLRITLEAWLRPGSPRVDLRVQVDNEARDHRLRILFPSGAVGAEVYHVEQAFDVVTRSIKRPDCTGWKEPQPSTGPQKSWVDVHDGNRGLCVINVGLPECEVMDDPERTVAVTLLRCTGQGVGLPEEQQDGQMLGRWSFTLGLLPHGSSWQEDRIWQAAHALNVPLRGAQTGLHEGPLPSSGSFLTVNPDELVATAVKVAEDERGVIVRAVNLGASPVEPQVEWIASAVKTPRRVRLDEELVDAPSEVRPREIVSLKFDVAPS